MVVHIQQHGRNGIDYSISSLELCRYQFSIPTCTRPVVATVQYRLPMHALFKHFPDIGVVVVRVACSSDDAPIGNVHTDARQYLKIRVQMDDTKKWPVHDWAMVGSGKKW